MFQYQFLSMSTTVNISIQHELFANDLMPVYKLFQLVEDKCSRFREDSELMRLNQKVGEEVKISEELFAILEQALHFYEKTHGIFNPGILSEIIRSGYAQSIEHIKGQNLSGMEKLPSQVSVMKPFDLNKSNQSVTPHTKLDLGGIAKGWVIDQAADVLEKVGYGFINVGGDIRIFGELPRPLNIGIEDPFDPSKIISSIQVVSGAIATSTTMKRRWLVNGENKHHLIDTRTGEPSLSCIVSSTVTAKTAIEADIWAKVNLLEGKDANNHKEVQTVLINKNGQVWKGGKLSGNV